MKQHEETKIQGRKIDKEKTETYEIFGKIDETEITQAKFDKIKITIAFKLMNSQ